MPDVKGQGEHVCPPSFWLFRARGQIMPDIINERIQKTLEAQYKPPPILWTNEEYIVPITGVYIITLVCITIICVIGLRPRPRSGPRRQDLIELAQGRQ